MQTLDREQLSQFIAPNEILFGTAEHPGLMLTPSGEIVKAFYRKKKLSTATFFPQAMQFTTSSRKLLELGISAPIVKDVIYCKEIPVHMVIYDRLDGKDLRERCEDGDIHSLQGLPAYLAHLHQAGIYFRAIHLGNILLDGELMSLVDISDLSAKGSPLGVLQRARNVAHLFNSQEDKAHFTRYGIDKFIAQYKLASDMGLLQERIFNTRLRAALDIDMRAEQV